MASNISTAWLSGLSKEEKVEFEQYLRNNFNTRVLERFFKILDDSLISVESRENSTNTYQDPSWAYKQAHFNGYRQAIVLVKSLFEGFK